MISCNRIDLFDDEQCKAAIELLDVYARDLMGGGEELSAEVKQNLPAELRKRASTCHVFIASSIEDSKTIPAGLAICFEGFSTFACKSLLNIHDFCVAPNYRRRGVASALMFAIESFARQKGFCKITLEVLSSNHPAKQLYAGAGFAPYELDPMAGQALFWQKKIEN